VAIEVVNCKHAGQFSSCPPQLSNHQSYVAMARSYFSDHISGAASDLLSPTATTPPATGAASYRPSALSTRITSVLSSSYADLDIRDALETLDARGIQNTPEARRNLRLDVQREIIQCNGEVVRDFGRVAEVVHVSSHVE